MFSEAANHIHKADKQVSRKLLSQLAVMKFIWMTLYILKNSQSPQRKVTKIVWQKRRLPDLTRVVNSVFIRKKSTLNIQQLFKKSFESVDKKVDMDCSIENQ